jgi:hypothetical protein
VDSTGSSSGQQEQAGQAGREPATPPPLTSREEIREPPARLPAGARDLIAGQYADRPHLRPILDTLLAAVPALGPVTVQARKTLVSLVTPRRTFAVVQATTKRRVDLGLRLDHARPGGRLVAANGGVGAATMRIPLTTPEDIDTEVLCWLQRAYDENSAPPPPGARPGARRLSSARSP